MKKVFSLIVNYWKKTSDCDAVLKNYKNYDDLEGSVQINHTYLSYDAIKTCLEDLRRLISVQVGLDEFSEIYWLTITKEKLADKLKASDKLEQNIWLLWASFLKREDLFPQLLNAGADISFYEQTYGLSSIHLAAFSGCTDALDHLLSNQGHSVNTIYKCYSPLHCAVLGGYPESVSILLEHGADIRALTNDSCILEGVLHCAVRANAIKCLDVLCKNGADVSQLNISGLSPIHLAASLGKSECLRMLLSYHTANINLQTKKNQQTALHLAARSSFPDCVKILLEFGGIIMLDHKNRTPLHLAAKAHCISSIKHLLGKEGINVNSEDMDRRTPLHLTLTRKSTQKNCSCEIVDTFIKYGADVNAKDKDNLTALHLAAQNQLPECVDVLIMNEADVTAKCKEGKTALKYICQKTPTSVDTIRKKLDSCIILLNKDHDSCSKEFEFQIDFCPIIRHAYPREALFLATLIDEGHKDLLLHPVCRAFIYLKWDKVKKYFILKALWCFLFVTMMSSYVVTGLARYCYNFSKNVTVSSYLQDKELCLNHSILARFTVNNPQIIETQWYILVVLAFGVMFRKICGFHGYSSFFDYFSYIENILDWLCIITVFLISFVYTGRTYIWQNHVSAFAILLSWVNLMFMLGQFPFFGTYVAMYISVQREFAKILLVFFSLLIGFTVTFCVLFPQSEVFSNIYIGLLTVSVMAVGEMNLELITKPSKEESIYMLKGSSEVIYATFVFCVSIIMLNLLIGIAVNDIKSLKTSARLTKLTKVVQLVNCIEKSLLADHIPQKFLVKCFKWDILISSDEEYSSFKAKVYSRSKLLSHHLLQEAYGILRKQQKRRKRCGYMCKKEEPAEILISSQENMVENNQIQVEIADLKKQLMNLSVEIVNVQNILKTNQVLMEQVLKVSNGTNDLLNDL
ncbi:transient receptor potential channel pyrexia-like isoform X2 [Anthonomus grandis grandis]|uniref:transient receptor potential channel pyrexia-like isoform X2 n=1 Tax=Anthonomus grandis grandis TaxID=2921223 RepID=UPI0021656E8C|nr:transient receptor potential channel pyrexia-like isoform X2 [Anthonomus grandis grandis]